MQHIVSEAQQEYPQIYPQAGWVEHNPLDIYSSQHAVLLEAIEKAGISADEIAAIGVTNQRETTIVWEKATGRPIYNAIVWQCRRTAEICEELEATGIGDYIKQNTGLRIDAYFSGTKIKWILDNVAGAKEKAKAGELLFGTVDTWLIWKLTEGRTHVTDYTNASRTMLYNIREKCWDKKILEALDVPESMLPQVKTSSEPYGYTVIDGVEVPIAGIAGDQQAALFGQTCFDKGDVKNTYGTGCFLLMNMGKDIVISKNGLLTTMAASADGKPRYALEGSVFVGGAVIQWLRDELGLVRDSSDTGYFASKVKDNGGVYVVPAFTGLGAPYWDMYARGAIFGLTRGSNRCHIIRAALESIAYQVKDVIDAMAADTGADIGDLRVDGGASANDVLMQFQADIIGKRTLRPVIKETTALGAAYLAGLAVGFWSDMDEIKSRWTLERSYDPQMPAQEVERNLAGWHRAVERTRHWVEE